MLLHAWLYVNICHIASIINAPKVQISCIELRKIYNIITKNTLLIHFAAQKYLKRTKLTLKKFYSKELQLITKKKGVVFESPLISIS